MVRKQQICDINARIDQLKTTIESGGSTDGIRENLGLVDDEITALRDRQELLESKIKTLVQALGDGIERVDRSERRVIATIKRARKELKEHGFESPGLESEATELRLVDGAGSDERGVPAVPEELASSPEQASSVRGVPLGTLQKVRGAIL